MNLDWDNALVRLFNEGHEIKQVGDYNYDLWKLPKVFDHFEKNICINVNLY